MREIANERCPGSTMPTFRDGTFVHGPERESDAVKPWRIATEDGRLVNVDEWEIEVVG